MRNVKWGFTALVAVVLGLGTTAQAASIQLAVSGSTSASAMTFTDNTTTWDISLPAATLTPQQELFPNNIGLITGTTAINMVALADTGLVPGDLQSENISALSFTTSAGNFTFDTIISVATIPGANPFTDATRTWVFGGYLNGSGFDPTAAYFYVFFNDNGTYGNAAWILVTTSPTPEPSSMVLAGLGVCGLVWQVRRRKVSA